MSYKTLSITVENHIATLTLNRPEQLNTMNLDFWKEFPLAVQELNKNTDVRVVILNSTGKHFTAGMDLSVFATPNPKMSTGEEGRRGEYIRNLVLMLQEVFSSLEKLRVPVLGAVQGGCIGGGLDMLCCTDSRYCTSDAYFQIKEIHLGMTADLGTLQRLPKLLPIGKVREMAYTGSKLNAQQAQAQGFVNEVFETQEDMMAHVMGIAKEIARQSPLAITGSKTMIRYAQDHSVESSLDYMALWQAGMFRPEDMMKSMQASMSKTDADFQPLTDFDTQFNSI